MLRDLEFPRSRSIPLLALVAATGLALPFAFARADDDRPASTPAPEEKEASDEAPKEKTEAELLDEQTKLITARIDLMQAQQREQLAKLELEKDRLTSEGALRDAKHADEMAAMKAELDRLTTAAGLSEARLTDQLAQLNAKLKEMQVSEQIGEAERRKGAESVYAEADQLRAQNQVMEGKVAAMTFKLQEAQTETATEAAAVTGTVAVRKAKDEASDVVLADIDYAKDPFQNGVLYVSDRRIALNDVIMEGTADWVVRRIEYFNNQSHDLPIFIVIDSCPGGSVMEGYRIVNAVQESQAPIYVVVKSYAASMAAVITTLADRSFAMPNAIILHHQMSSGAGGNLTEIKEQYENAIEWSKRLHEPVCKKLGIPYDDFVKQMYAHNSAGNWEEFGDRAKDLKWVNEVVTDIREVGVRARPVDPAPLPWYFFLLSSSNRYERTAAQDNTNAASMIQRDEKGLPFIQLPPLRPFDYYFLYNPNHFYRY